MSKNRLLLGCDVGSSSVKVSLFDADNGTSHGSAYSPKEELAIDSPRHGWAEQHPELWWKHLKLAVKELLFETDIDAGQISAIGISYQMHGLVAVDKKKNVVRPSIIWCDSRAASIGDQAFKELGPEISLKRFLNSPGNFTASKLKWVQENEPDAYEKIDKIMLPGDYICMKMTGEISTTISGLSEGIFWDFESNSKADLLLDHYGISDELLPEAHESFSNFGKLTNGAAKELGLNEGILVTYKAGDQPNNAFSLNVLNPGDIATTAGTSGVIYGITDQPAYDEQSRVNTFVHVNHQKENPSYGVLLCINGTGILYRWIRQHLLYGGSLSYQKMNELAEMAPIGSDGVTILPFGNGAERILENRNLGSGIQGLDFNRHNRTHILRAAQEGIVFSMNYGFDIMKKMGVDTQIVKAGLANMFQSPLFREAFVNTTGTTLELYKTDGAEGAARGAGVGAGIFSSPGEAFKSLERLQVNEPEKEKSKQYKESYQKWVERLEQEIS